MRDELNKILGNVNDWLKFAEAKNAALVAFNCAAVAGILQAFPPDKELQFCKGLMVFLFGASICISIFSFLPVLTRTFRFKKLENQVFEAQLAELNCYFFSHHSKISCTQLLKLLQHKSGGTNLPTSEIEMDIADQIINNAEIAVSKFKLFAWAAYITFAGVVCGLVVILIKVV